MFLYFNLCLSVMVDSLSCLFTSISFLTNVQVSIKEMIVSTRGHGGENFKKKKKTFVDKHKALKFKRPFE